MKGEDDINKSNEKMKSKDKTSQMDKIYKALLIGIACGVLFILAAKMVNVAIS